MLAPTLAGHAGGPAIEGDPTDTALADAAESAMDAAGFDTAHRVGNSRGGLLALQLAARGRAETVVALAPAGGWADGDDTYTSTLRHFRLMHGLLQDAAPHADQIVASPEGRRRASEFTSVVYEHIPPELLAHQIRGEAACEAALPLIDHATRDGWKLDAEHVNCPVRIVWGTEDRLLPWPSAAARFRADWVVPQADWVELENVGHCPQLDVPLETAQLILGFTT